MGFRIAILGLSLNTTERLVVIKRSDRKDTPHLTLSFQNVSGEIDCHLKYESPLNDAASTYKSLFAISKENVESTLQNFLVSAEQAFLQSIFGNVRKVRPGWLGRHGYVIAISDEEVVKRGFIDAAPKLRGKYRVDFDKLKLFLTVDHISNISIFNPSILHHLAAINYDGQIIAMRLRKRQKHFMVGLKCIQWEDRKIWVMADSKIVHKVQIMFDNLIPSNFRVQVKNIWYTIFDELRLAEIGFTKD